MTEDPTKTTSEIETLLADRRQLNDWLERLASADAPEAVRQRVRADYEGRLAEVVVRLGSFSDTLSGSLQEYRARLNEVESRQTEAAAERAEAKLRHQVGEYSDEEWQKLDSATASGLEGFQAEIDELAAEIGRLDEVLTQIAPGDNAGPDEDLADLEVHPLNAAGDSLEGYDDGDSTDATSDPGTDIGSRTTEAPRFTPKGGESRREGTGTRTLRFPTAGSQPGAGGGTGSDVDEMTFIKSVTLETREADAEGRSRGSNSKTLKCAECGSMNRPTEWYCERCGAELAAL